MTPTFRIIADGADITALINDRLLLLRTTDKPRKGADDFELRIDDRDSAVSLPSRGASIEVFLSYSGSALTRLGRYTVDEVELSGPPDTLVIRGKATVVDRSTHKAVNTQYQDKKPASWPSSPEQGPSPGCLPSTAPPLRYAWKCPAAPTCLPNEASTPRALKPVLMASTWWTRSCRSSPKAAGSPPLNATAASRANPFRLHGNNCC